MTLKQITDRIVREEPEIRASMAEADRALAEGRTISADEVFPDEEDAALPDTKNL